MAANPETVVTQRVRDVLKGAGAHFIKLSDQFTRGVPDALLVTDRILLVEFKVDRRKRDPNDLTYKQLGLSGAQDHHIRQICRRNTRGACVVTDSVDGGKLRLWLPLRSHGEGAKGFETYVVYECDEKVYAWLLGKTYQT